MVLLAWPFDAALEVVSVERLLGAGAAGLLTYQLEVLRGGDTHQGVPLRLALGDEGETGPHQAAAAVCREERRCDVTVELWR